MPDSEASRPPRDLTDLELLNAHLAGDQRALGYLFTRHQSLLMFIAFDILRDRSDAEDVVQSAALSVVRAAPHFEARASVKNWLVRITRNAALDVLRRRQVRPTTGLGEGYEERVLDMIDVGAVAGDRAVVDELLWELPELTRRIVVMIDLLDLDYATVAGILSIPVGTVKSRRFRAMRFLAARLGS